MKYRTILLVGSPGSGKGTQGRILGNIPGFYYFSSGDAFRNVRPDDPIGQVFLEYSSKGLLVPDETTIQLWATNMQASTMDGEFSPTRDTLLLDGFPRNRRQADLLKDTLDVKAILHLTCHDKSLMIERLQRRALQENRADDANLEVIRKRLETYERDTKPVLDFYGPQLVHAIDSTQTPLVVLRDVINVLAEL
jgi:adenylate kinase